MTKNGRRLRDGPISPNGKRLAKGGVDKFLEDIRPFLRQKGVELPTISETYDESGYSIQIGAERLVLWEAADWHARGDYHYPWQLTPERTFAFVNQALIRAGSAERLFAISGGEDLEAVFLTESQFDVIRQYPTRGNWWDKPHRIEDAG